MISVEFTGAPDGDDGPFSVGSSTAWHEFALWAPKGGLIQHMLDVGEVYDTVALREELDKAGVPDTHGARIVYENLTGAIGVGDPDETIEVLH